MPARSDHTASSPSRRKRADVTTAARKLWRKGADVAVINDLEAGAMGGTENACTLAWGEQSLNLPRQSKLSLARALLRALDPCLS